MNRLIVGVLLLTGFLCASYGSPFSQRLQDEDWVSAEVCNQEAVDLGIATCEESCSNASFANHSLAVNICTEVDSVWGADLICSCEE